MNAVFFSPGDSSLANVPLSDEEEVNKHNGNFLLWDRKTVTAGNKGSNKRNSKEPKLQLTIYHIWCVAFLLCNLSNLGLRIGIV